MENASGLPPKDESGLAPAILNLARKFDFPPLWRPLDESEEEQEDLAYFACVAESQAREAILLSQSGKVLEAHAKLVTVGAVVLRYLASRYRIEAR